MGYEAAHAPIYGYMKGHRHTIPLHLVHYARTFSIFKLLNRLDLGRVLNVGGADGYHSHLLRTIFGADVTTLDISEPRLKLAQEKYGLDVLHGSALDIPLPDDSCDTALCIETIEHIEDPQRVVDELRRVAKRHVVISTESFFDSEEQKREFLLYIRETHPRFFRAENPERPGDVSHFTLDDFHTLFRGETVAAYPQFSHKQREILGDIDTVRTHVRTMTEDLPVNRRTKVIVHHSRNGEEPGPERVPEDELLAAIVTDEPLFPLDRDDEMVREDQEGLRAVHEYHAESALCRVVEEAAPPALPIEEPGARGMTMQWLTADDNERSPDSCIRKVRLAPRGTTPSRKTSWEHQLHVLSGEGELIEDTRRTALHPGVTVLVRPGLSFRVENTGPQQLEYLDVIPSVTRFFGR